LDRIGFESWEEEPGLIPDDSMIMAALNRRGGKQDQCRIWVDADEDKPGARSESEGEKEESEAMFSLKERNRPT
jgi:hypothetical protein